MNSGLSIEWMAMFERSFLWAVRHGARILFAIALVYLVVGVVYSVMSAVELGGDASKPFGKPSWLLFVVGLASAVMNFGILLFGAIAIDCFNRWIAGKPSIEKG